MAKGKSSSKAAGVANELQFLMNFNASITQAMAKTLEHLSDFVFVTVANTTLARRDSYLSHLKAGIKPDTLASLRTAPLHIPTLFPDEALRQAEQDIATFQSKGQLHSGKKGRFHLYDHPEKRGDNRKQERPAWKNIGQRGHGKKSRPPTTPQDRPRASSLTNDSYCVLTTRLLAGSMLQRQTDTFVNLNVVPCVHTVPGHSQKKEISPGAAVCLSQKNYKIKSVKLASCVTPLSCVKPVVNARNAVTNPPVGTRLQKFWQVWLNLGASRKIVQILKAGYTLPFQNRPLLSRHSTVISCYVNHHKNSYLSEALHQLISKNAVELVQNPNSLGVFNRFFLVPKPNNKWRPILDLSKLNLFLRVEKFKMETPETIRTSLQQGEWVTSIDLKDAYFHIPIQEQSRKYLRFHVQGQTYQFKALPFGLSTAPLEFTVVAKEVKLMAMHKGIRIHQYLDDWLVRAKSHQVCLQGSAENMPRPGLDSQLREIRAGTKTSLRLCRLPIRPQNWVGSDPHQTVGRLSEQRFKLS